MNLATPILLFLYAVVAVIWAPVLVRRWRWLDRSPGAAIAVWQALTASALLSIVLAGFALALPTLPMTTNLADLFQACANALRADYATPAGASASAIGGVAAAAAVSRAGWGVGRYLWIGRRATLRQTAGLRLIAKPLSAVSNTVQVHVESSELLVYCLPGRPGTIVFTTAALARLDQPQTAAVLAHELAHLRSRHHLLVAVARGLHLAFPFAPLFRIASTELERLVEIHADDTAARAHDRRVLATALIELAAGRSPAGGLGATGAATTLRIRRLAAPPNRLNGIGRTLVTTTVSALLTIPVVLVALPALGTLAAHYCPVPLLG